MPLLTRVKQEVLNLLFPLICQKCGREGAYLCATCAAGIETPLPICIVCDKPSPFGQTHATCQNRNQALSGVLVASNYNEAAIRQLIWQLKYGSATSIAHDLGLLLCDFLISQNLTDYFVSFTVTAVPLHKKRRRLRGFNQAELLSQELARRFGFAYRPLLEKTKKTKRQVDLEKQERLKNIKGSFALLPAAIPLPERVLLIDDVASTGATLNECARVLKRAGAQEVWALVIARNK